MSDDMKVEAEVGRQDFIPNLDNLDPWLEKFVTEADVSYTSEPRYTPEQALDQTREQFRLKVRNRETMRNEINRQRKGPYLTRQAYDQQLTEELMDMAGLPLPTSTGK